MYIKLGLLCTQINPRYNHYLKGSWHHAQPPTITELHVAISISTTLPNQIEQDSGNILEISFTTSGDLVVSVCVLGPGRHFRWVHYDHISECTSFILLQFHIYYTHLQG